MHYAQMGSRQVSQKYYNGWVLCKAQFIFLIDDCKKNYMQSLKLLLFSYYYKEKYIILCERKLELFINFLAYKQLISLNLHTKSFIIID